MGASLMTNVLALADTLGVKKDFHVDADREYSFSNPLVFSMTVSQLSKGELTR